MARILSSVDDQEDLQNKKISELQKGMVISYFLVYITIYFSEN